MNNRPKVGASEDIGWWLSAALDDPAVCDEMKAAINKCFAAGQPAPQLLAQMLDAMVWAEAALAPFSKEPADKCGISKLRAAIFSAQDALASSQDSGADRTGSDMGDAYLAGLEDGQREEEGLIRQLLDAINPFASLETPKLKNGGNAGAYSLLLADIQRAKEVVAMATQVQS